MRHTYITGCIKTERNEDRIWLQNRFRKRFAISLDVFFDKRKLAKDLFFLVTTQGNAGGRCKTISVVYTSLHVIFMLITAH